jgi:hypothetical protein
LVPPELDRIVTALRGCARYEDAAPVLTDPPVALDGNLSERLARLATASAQRGDPRAAEIRQAMNLIEEFRYRAQRDDLFGTADARAFVTEIAAQPTVEAGRRFVAENDHRFDADVVEALFAFGLYCGDADDRTLANIEGLARHKAGELELFLPHRPPSDYRVIIEELYGAYQQYRMRDVLHKFPHLIDGALGFTLAGIFDWHMRAGSLTADFVHFIESLCKRISEWENARPFAYDAAAYLYGYCCSNWTRRPTLTRWRGRSTTSGRSYSSAGVSRGWRSGASRTR